MITSCDIDGSADASVKNAVIADLNQVLRIAKVEKILLNGALAYQLFCQHYQDISIPYVKMPSTSPANPRFNEEIWRNELNDVFRISQ